MRGERVVDRSNLCCLGGNSDSIRPDFSVLSKASKIQTSERVSERLDRGSVGANGRCVVRDLSGQGGLLSDISTHSSHLSINVVLDAVHSLSDGFGVGADSSHACGDAGAHILLGGGHP